MEYSVYLAGPIRGRSYDEAMAWRRYVRERLPETIRVLSPLRAKPYLAAMGKLADARPDTRFPLSTPKGIVCRDFFDVRRCDCLLVNFLGAASVSIGTILEIGAAHILQKPIIIVMDETNGHNYSLLREIPGFVVPTLDEGIEIVKAVLLPGV